MMSKFMKAFIEYHFHGDVLAFRCYCLTHHVEPRKGTNRSFTPYVFWQVPMRERKGLAKRLILMTREKVLIPEVRPMKELPEGILQMRTFRRYKGHEYVDAPPSINGLLKELHFDWIIGYNYFKEDGYYICLINSPKGHLQLYACWQDKGEVMSNTFDPFDENPGMDREMLVSAICYLVDKGMDIDQFIKIG